MNWDDERHARERAERDFWNGRDTVQKNPYEPQSQKGRAWEDELHRQWDDYKKQREERE